MHAGDQVKLKDGSVKKVLNTYPNEDFLNLKGTRVKEFYKSNYTSGHWCSRLLRRTGSLNVSCRCDFAALHE